MHVCVLVSVYKLTAVDTPCNNFKELCIDYHGLGRHHQSAIHLPLHFAKVYGLQLFESQLHVVAEH